MAALGLAIAIIVAVVLSAETPRQGLATVALIVVGLLGNYVVGIFMNGPE